MMLLFWVAIAWLAYIYVGYPVILGLLALIARVRPMKDEEYYPSVSVLIAARNEEKDIGWKAEETLAWDYPAERLEVLIASDASEDRTDEILSTIRDPRLTVVRMEQRGGKNRALNRLAERAKGEILFFTDANAHVDRHCIRRMVRHLADPRVGCVTGDTRTARESASLAVGQGASLYLRYDALLTHLENLVGSALVCNGAVFCIRRALYRPVLPELANDLELPMHIAHTGQWILHEPEAWVLEKDTSSPREDFDRRRRICAQGLLAMWKLRYAMRGIRGWQFLSHKFLRWLTLLPLGMILIASAAMAGKPFFAGLLMIQLVFYCLGLMGWIQTLARRRCSWLLSVPFYVLLGSVGAFAGMVDAVRGKRFAVWEIPKLSRGGDDATMERV